jgi:hypothetical protein
VIRSDPYDSIERKSSAGRAFPGLIEMAAGAVSVRPSAGDVEVLPALLAAEKDMTVDPVIWGDEERMKRELMAWAKAVASMALNASPAPPTRTRHGSKCPT